MENSGKIEDASGIGKFYNSLDYGDVVKFYIKTSDEKIEAIKFEACGCLATIVSASMFTKMAKGKTIAEALKIERQNVGCALGGLPENKINCSVISLDVFRKAVKNYEKNKKDRFLTGYLKNNFAG